MTERLETPLVHRFIESPLGRVLYLSLVEKLKIGTIDSEFTVLRARAIADVAGTSVDQFCEEAGITGSLDDSFAEDLRTALEEHAETKAAFERVHAEWNDTFWGETDATLDERTTLEREHREAGEAWIAPQKTFGFVSKANLNVP